MEIINIRNTGINISIAVFGQMLIGWLKLRQPKNVRTILSLFEIVLWVWWASGFIIPYPLYAGVRGWHTLEL